MHRFGVSAILLFSYAYYVCIEWRLLTAAALLPPSTERVHRRSRQLPPPLRPHFRTAESAETNVQAAPPTNVDDELRLAAELTRPNADVTKFSFDDYGTLLGVLLDEVLFIHSKHKKIVRTGACAKIVDNKAVILRSIARSTKSLVGIQVSSRTPISYCEPANWDEITASPSTRRPAVSSEAVSNNERLALARILFGARSAPRVTNQCALDSKCVTIYRWKPAKVDWTGDGKYSADRTEKVLVPSGCTCVINAVNDGLFDMPVIVF